MTANADYGVTIVESFRPTDNLTPGTKINKDVQVVNTGSIDSFVRLWFDNKLTMKVYKTENAVVANGVDTEYYIDGLKVEESAVNTKLQAGAEKIFEEAVASIIDASDASKIDASAVSTDVTNATSALTSALSNLGDTTTTITLTAGQAYATAKTSFTEAYVAAAKPSYKFEINKFKLNSTFDATNAIELNTTAGVDKSGNAVADEVTTLQAGGTLVVAGSKAVIPSKQLVLSGTNGSYVKYSPATDNNNEEGLYLFRRSVDGTTYTYSGYYYSGGKYYAISNTASGNITVTSTDVGDGKMVTAIANMGIKALVTPTFTTEEQADGKAYDKVQINFVAATPEEGSNVKTKDITARTTTVTDINTKTNGYNYIEVRFAGANGAIDVPTYEKAEQSDKTEAEYIALAAADKEGWTLKDSDDIVFYVELDANWTDSWTYTGNTTANASGFNATNSVGYFAYKDDLEAGLTTAKLIDSVTFSDAVDQKDFGELTYDLNAIIQSIQVTVDEAGKENGNSLSEWTDVTATVVNATTASGITGGSTAADGLEITGITWAKK